MPSTWKLIPEWKIPHSGFETLSGGYALPKRMTARAESGDVEVEIEIEIEGGRAHARAVTVRRSPDVTSTTLRSVPIRDVIASTLRATLMRVEAEATDESGRYSATFSPVAEIGETEIALVKSLVGYVEVQP